MDAGDEMSAQKFLTDNLNSFPEDFRDNVVLCFFEEALRKSTDEEEALSADGTALQTLKKVAKEKTSLGTTNA